MKEYFYLIKLDRYDTMLEYVIGKMQAVTDADDKMYKEIKKIKSMSLDLQ